MKLVKKLLVLLLAAIPLLVVVHILVHTTLLEKEVKTSNGLKYTNSKWAYSVELSNDWKRINRFFSQVILFTNAAGFVSETQNLDFQITGKEFYEDDNKNLMKFVQDDVKYGEQNQSVKTEDLRELYQSGNRWVIGWIGRYSEGYFIQYYIFNKSDPESNIIYVLYFSSENPFSDSQKEESTKVLSSFNIIN